MVWNDNAVQPGSAGGGGPSERFGRPAYQNGATKSKGRVVPDVSMLADVLPGYTIYCTAGPPDCDPDSDWISVGGTSAATPLLAGGFALVDEALRAAGRARPRARQPAAVQARRVGGAEHGVRRRDGRRQRRVPAGRVAGGALGCCAAAAGFDDASGWGSLNVAAFEQAAVLAEPPIMHIALSVAGRQERDPRAARSGRRSRARLACLPRRVRDGAHRQGSAVEQDSRVVSREDGPGSAVVMIPAVEDRAAQAEGGRRTPALTATVYGICSTPVYDVIRAAGESIQSQTEPGRQACAR